MKFFNDGAVNFPYLSDGMVPHPAQALGPARNHPDYSEAAKQVNQIDLYKSVASAMKISVPKDVMRSAKLIDGVVWDGKNPAQYADGFKDQGLKPSHPRQPHSHRRSPWSAPYSIPAGAPSCSTTRSYKINSYWRLPRKRYRPKHSKITTTLGGTSLGGAVTRLLATGTSARLRPCAAAGPVGFGVGQHGPQHPGPARDPTGAGGVPRPVLPQRPQRPGRGLERADVAAARGHRLWPGGAGGHSGGVCHRSVHLSGAHVQPADRAAAPCPRRWRGCPSGCWCSKAPTRRPSGPSSSAPSGPWSSTPPRACSACRRTT